MIHTCDESYNVLILDIIAVRYLSNFYSQDRMVGFPLQFNLSDAFLSNFFFKNFVAKSLTVLTVSIEVSEKNPFSAEIQHDKI